MITKTQSVFQSLNADAQIIAAGDLAERAQLNAQRLEQDVFEPQCMFERMGVPTEPWPGDTEGRLLLGQVRLARSLGRHPEKLDELLGLWDNYTNERGYFGAIHETINEQQLSSHGWVLRGLGELYAWRQCDWSAQRIQNIIKHLVLPCRGKYAQYPIDNREGIAYGMHSGDNACESDGWTLSTDFGCAFILMDGVIQAYEHFPSEELAALIEEMIERFVLIDVVGLGLQTHATLTCLRGLMRWVSLRPDRQDLLNLVQRTFDIYFLQGMTETFANHNWFNDPRWTEPCAIVDSMQVARQLYMATGIQKYRDLWQLIRWNGFAHGQRANGGFGPDSCVGSSCEHGGSEHQLKPSVPEAYWCCSMRGTEGLADLISEQVLQRDDQENEIWYFPLAESCSVNSEARSVEIMSQYPWQGKWQVKGQGLIALAAPEWCSNWSCNGEALSVTDGYVQIELTGDADTVEVTCDLAMQQQQQMGERNISGYFAWRHGPVLLGRSGTDFIACDETPRQTADKQWQLGEFQLTALAESWRGSMVQADDKAEQPFAAWTQQVLWSIN